MGRDQKKKAKKGAAGKAGGAKAHTPEMLIEQGNIALGSMELELAAEFFSRALALSKDDTNIMDALADVMMQIGDTEKALELLLSSTVMAPTENPFKWFFLGQLQFEFDAVKSYKTGIQILSDLVKSETDNDTKTVMLKQIAKAHCSIAEIYLTDLCFEEDAERVCESCVAAAQQAYPASLDAQQTLASLRLSQNRKGEAGGIITTVCNELMRIRGVVAARTVVQEISGEEEPAEFQDLPEMAFCIATLKLLIECATDPRHASLYVRAQELGSGLLEEDDENIELWYLMGVACMGGVDGCSASSTASANNSAAAPSKAGKKGTKKSAAPVAVQEEGEGTDLAAAQFHFETALEMMGRLREEQQRMESEETDGAPSGEFMYQQQWDLVQDHLRIIAAATGADPNLPAGTGAGAGAGAGKVQAPVDEEWSDAEEGEGEMAVDK